MKIDQPINELDLRVDCDAKLKKESRELLLCVLIEKRGVRMRVAITLQLC